MTSSTTASYRVMLGSGDPGGAVVREVDQVALADQPAPDGVGDHPVVLDHEQATAVHLVTVTTQPRRPVSVR